MASQGHRARSRGRKPRGRQSPPPTVTLSRQAIWVVFAGLWLFLVLGLASFDPADPPSHAVAVHNEPVANLCGRFGASAAYWSLHVAGMGAWVVLAGWGAFLGAALTGRRITHPVVRSVGIALMALAVATGHALVLPDVGLLRGAPSGLLGDAIGRTLLDRFNLVGSLLFASAGLLIGLIVAFDRILRLVPQALGSALDGILALPGVIAQGVRSLFSRPATALAGAASRRPTASARPAIGSSRGGTASRRAAASAPAEPEVDDEAGDDADVDAEGDEETEWEWVDDDEADDAEGDDADDADDDPEADADEDWEVVAEDPDDAEDDGWEVVDEDLDEDEDDEEDAYEDDDESAEPAGEDDAAAGPRQQLTEEELREKIARLPVRMASRSTKVARDEDIPRDAFRDYQFPTLDLLKDPESNFTEIMERTVREQAEKLEQSLNIYGIDAEIVGIESGPAITLYAVELAPGTKVAKVQAIASDLARSLGAPNIRIVANMSGRTSIGIEVPNIHREKVRLKELMSGGQSEGMILPMFLGKDASGEPLVADLTRMPHMLIAGTTGSGKSVCMNTILMSWLYTKRPDELKLVLVDPKMVEMSQFQEIPHLMCPVVTESTKAAAIMEWAVERMEERYELLREAHVQNIQGYNKLTEEELFEAFNAVSDEEKARIPKRLPYLVFVVDELADLMMTCREVEQSIVRIAQKARAVGIHLILATQRPQANVVTGLIKANMPCRVSFKVSSGMDSRIVLDHKGAELLLGQGDMLFLTPHSSELRRAQGTLVENTEIKSVTKFIRTVAAPTFERSLMQLRSPKSADAAVDLDVNERDPLFDQAVEIMIESGRGSVSLLQRRLGIGYGRASRLVDQMGLAGIVGDHKGSVAREILITLDEWRAMKRLEEEAAATADPD